MKLRYILSGLEEASYFGNLGVIEMVKFYKKATKNQIKQMEKIVSDNDMNGFKKLIKQVIGVEIK